MKNAFVKSEFLANAVISSLRKGELPTPEESEALDSRPLIDTLRRKVEAEDVPWLLQMVKEKVGGAAGLAISLLRNHVADPRVRECFEARWEGAEPYVKNRLMWRLLDNPRLTGHWRHRFFRFVIDERESFRAFNRAFFGGGAEGVYNVLSRIGDTSFPDSKRWVYLCCLQDVFEDRGALNALLSLVRSSSDRFEREVADELLKGLSEEAGCVAPQAPADEAAGLGFLSAAVISYLRENRPSEDDADLLNRLPLIDRLRGQVREENIPHLLDVVETESGAVAALYLSLLRSATSKPEVQRRLRARWDSADAFLRAHLMWRLLDDPELPPAWHRELFNFVLDNWAEFHEVSLRFLGTPDTVVTRALLRIADPSFPPTKKWAYLCRVPEVASDKAAARALVELGAIMPNPFTREVASVLLKRFF